MLGWVMVRWHSQSSQKDTDNKNNRPETQDGILNKSPNCEIKVVPETNVSGADDTLSLCVAERPPLTLGSLKNGSAAQDHELERTSVSTAVLSTVDVLSVQKQSLEEPENSEMDIPKESLILEPSETPMLLAPPPGHGSLGGTVNLILSIGKKGEKETPQSQAKVSPPLGQETLHKVKEKDGDATHGTSISRPRTIRQMPPRTYSSPLPSPGWSTTASQTLPKTSSSYFLQSLKRKGKGKPAGDAQLLTLQGIMGTEVKDLQLVQEEKHRTSSTWPQKNSRRAQRLWTPRDVTDYMRNPLAHAIDTECDSVGETAGGLIHLGRNQGLSSSQVSTEKMSTCQHLSLGSILSLQLPKDPTVFRNVHETIKVIKAGLAERKGVSHGCQVAQGNSDRVKVQEKSTPLQKRGPGEQPGIYKSIIKAEDVHSKDNGSTWFEEVSVNPSYIRQKAYIVAPCGEDRHSPKSQSSSGDNFLDFRQNRLSRISVLHEQIGWEWDKLATSLGTTGSSSEVEAKDSTEQKAKIREVSRVRLKPSPTKHTNNAGATSYTQVKNSLANETPGKENTQSPVESFIRITPLLPSAVKSPPKMPVFELDPQEASSESGPLILTSRGNATEGPKSQGMPEMCHPAHELFEEEEEELQAIWSNVEKDKRSTETHSITGKKADKIQSPDNSGEKLILTSADNQLPSKLELQMMEGTLERKHLLQAGGKKQSSAVACPLNVSGAVCTLNKEYTKKNNCFTLQMKDGSKYLLRAPTEPLVKEWVIKLQQNSASQTAQEKTSAVSVIPGQGVSHFLGFHQPLTTKNQEAILKSRVRMQLPYGTHEDPLDIAASHTATYQKISPLSVSKEPMGAGSSYSVTLYIGEQASSTPRPRCHSFVTTPCGSQETLGGRSQGASPRQKNKSVFRKLFGKKD
ncbi:hypothetical protein JD844_025033 [Phrynosoma platyrhinos]|uniref:Uncharacterized protein n=1 Tax=Phrynosoma platyrhinos TaxID=52577 RepID=A0ABQ7SYY5_PHRPL|nr:hypothetical protein JD844_025033 [Phrynosoma platyrhinos]